MKYGNWSIEGRANWSTGHINLLRFAALLLTATLLAVGLAMIDEVSGIAPAADVTQIQFQEVSQCRPDPCDHELRRFLG
jgi:hypothetical protein